MTPTPIAYRVVSGDFDEWFDDPAAAHLAVAQRLGIPPDQVGPLGRPVAVDPVVVRRHDGRWRSRRVSIIRSGSAAARLYEMLQVDEAAYDH